VRGPRCRQTGRPISDTLASNETHQRRARIESLITTRVKNDDVDSPGLPLCHRPCEPGVGPPSGPGYERLACCWSCVYGGVGRKGAALPLREGLHLSGGACRMSSLLSWRSAGPLTAPVLVLVSCSSRYRKTFAHCRLPLPMCLIVEFEQTNSADISWPGSQDVSFLAPADQGSFYGRAHMHASGAPTGCNLGPTPNDLARRGPRWRRLS
jgi:hypothetical protein